MCALLLQVRKMIISDPCDSRNLSFILHLQVIQTLTSSLTTFQVIILINDLTSNWTTLRSSCVEVGEKMMAAAQMHMDNDILIEIPKGPNKGKCLARLIHQQQLSRSTPWIPQTLGRAASRLLWSDTDMTEHMLSPTGKGRRSENSRKDFSPERKKCFKG